MNDHTMPASRGARLALYSTAPNGKEAVVLDESDKNPTNPEAPPGPAAPATPARTFRGRYETYVVVGVLILAAIAAGFALGRIGRNSNRNDNRLVLYGNIDLRQVDLAFNNSERIAEVLVAEGCQSHARTSFGLPLSKPSW